MNYRIVVFPPSLKPLVGRLFDESELEAVKKLLSSLGDVTTFSLEAEDGNFWYLPKEMVTQSIVCIELDLPPSLGTANQED